MSDDSELDIKEFVHGINFVRPPTLEFTKLQETNEFIEYEIFTKKNNDMKEGDNFLIDHLNSFIFCNDTITIKQPKKKIYDEK